MLKKYLIKIGFYTITDLEKAKKSLTSVGIKSSDIDYMLIPRKKGKGLRIEKETKGPLLSLKFFLIGLIVGIILYFLYLFQTSELEFLGTLLSVNFKNFLLCMFLVASTFMVIGYSIGKKVSLHSIKFSDKEPSSNNMLMSVNVDSDQLDIANESLSHINTENIEIIDTKKEVEVGLRNQ